MTAERDQLESENTALRAELEALESPAPDVDFMGGLSTLPDATSTARALWTKLIGDLPDDDMQLALEVTEYIHRNVPGGIADTSGGIAERLVNAISGEGEEALCGDYALFSTNALSSLGIPARVVQLAAQSYVDGKANGDTHVTVEAFVDDRWLIIDPTFNARFTCGEADWVDISAAQACRGKLQAVQGRGTVPGRAVEDYYLEFKKLLPYYIRYSAQIGNALTPVEHRPRKGWLADALAEHYRPPPSN